MKETKPTVDLVVKRISGVLRAQKRGDVTVTEALSNIARIVREVATAEARRSAA